MEMLSRINDAFENVRLAIKTKKSSELLQHLQNDIQALSRNLVSLGKENHDQYVRSLAMEGYLALVSAKTLPLPLTEKRNVLQIAFDKLKPYSLRDECLFIFLRLQNLLCYYLIQLNQLIAAKTILDEMEDLYDKISHSSADQFMDTEDLFTTKSLNQIKKVKADKIDRIITNNIQMQAFLHNKLDMPDKYTLYNHTALRRQLEMKEGTPQDWAVRSARLGNYFTYLNQLSNARHHLCAAYHVLKTCHDNCKLVPEEFVNQKAVFEMHFLELSHYWVKYGLALFKLSKKKVLGKCFPSKVDLWQAVDTGLDLDTMEDGEMKDLGNEKQGGDCVPDLYVFTSLDLSEVERKVPINEVTKIEDARKLFTFTHKWLIRAKHYYDMEHYSAQYISCCLQLSELYEHLVFFEKNVDNQYHLQKRRADELEKLNALLKTCDNVTSVQIDVIRELSQVQLELMALNLQKLWREESQTNLFNDTDANSIINSLSSMSNETITAKTLNASSKNMFLKKMDALSSINGKLMSLSGQLSPSTPSQLTLTTTK